MYIHAHKEREKLIHSFLLYAVKTNNCTSMKACQGLKKTGEGMREHHVVLCDLTISMGPDKKQDLCSQPN